MSNLQLIFSQLWKLFISTLKRTSKCLQFLEGILTKLSLRSSTTIVYTQCNLFVNKVMGSFISIYKFGLSVCLFVCLFGCLYPINVKTAEPIWPKFFLRSRATPGKVYGWSNFQKFASIKIRFLKILKIHEFFFENPRNFFFCYLLTRRTPVYFISNKIFTNEIKDPKSLERRARSALNF